MMMILLTTKLHVPHVAALVFVCIATVTAFVSRVMDKEIFLKEKCIIHKQECTQYTLQNHVLLVGDQENVTIAQETGNALTVKEQGM